MGGFQLRDVLLLFDGPPQIFGQMPESKLQIIQQRLAQSPNLPLDQAHFPTPSQSYSFRACYVWHTLLFLVAFDLVDKSLFLRLGQIEQPIHQTIHSVPILGLNFSSYKSRASFNFHL